jgi:hypothetical protein
VTADASPSGPARRTPARRQPARPAETAHPPGCEPRRHTPRRPVAAKSFTIRIDGTGELVGELHSLEAAHQIAHCYLGAWPDLSPLAVADREHDDEWHVRAGVCSPPGCDIALDLAETAEAQAAWFITGEGARALFGLPPLPQPPEPGRPATTAGGLPIRIPTALPVQRADTTIDPALLERVLQRLRRL